MQGHWIFIAPYGRGYKLVNRSPVDKAKAASRGGGFS